MPKFVRKVCFMIRYSIVLFCLLLTRVVYAQDFSNRGLLEIKDQSENLRTAWMKAFDDAVQSRNFSALAPIRKDNEVFLDKNISGIRRLTAEGDGRGLLTAVANYLQIEKQFVRDAMIQAETINGSNQEAIDRIYQKINDFGQKEKAFLVDINNALATEKEDAAPPSSVTPDSRISDDDEFEEPHGSVVEGKETRHKKKSSRDEKPEKRGKKTPSEETDEE